MRRLLVSIVLLSCLLPPAIAAAAPSWRGWDDGLASAARLGRPVLADVYTDWCGWCRRMDRDVYERADIEAYVAAHFVPVKLDAEGRAMVRYEGRETTGATLAGRLGVRAYPTTVFLDARGKRLLNVPGYVPADRFLLLLRYVAEGHAERGVSFDDFARSPAARAPARR
jgi:thioredoxin-related protein